MKLKAILPDCSALHYLLSIASKFSKRGFLRFDNRTVTIFVEYSTNGATGIIQISSAVFTEYTVKSRANNTINLYFDDISTLIHALKPTSKMKSAMDGHMAQGHRPTAPPTHTTLRLKKANIGDATEALEVSLSLSIESNIEPLSLVYMIPVTVSAVDPCPVLPPEHPAPGLTIIMPPLADLRNVLARHGAFSTHVLDLRADSAGNLGLGVSSLAVDVCAYWSNCRALTAPSPNGNTDTATGGDGMSTSGVCVQSAGVDSQYGNVDTVNRSAGVNRELFEASLGLSRFDIEEGVCHFIGESVTEKILIEIKGSLNSPRCPFNSWFLFPVLDET